MPLPVTAQTLEREGKLQLAMVEAIISESDTILSSGTLNNLETDPNFTGSLDLIYGEATSLLDAYTAVERGGYFPENVGIPRSQQLTTNECVYRLFKLDNGNELMLYRSPLERSSRYLIQGESR